jgi:uncharacterized membrane protein YvbJ
MEYFENIKKEIKNKMPKIIESIFIFIIFLIVATIIKNNTTDNEKDVVDDEKNYISRNLIQHQIAHLIYYIILIIGAIFCIV